MLAWDRAAAKAGVRHSVFCASLSDWADAEVPDAWRFDLFQTIAASPNLDWLLLSKSHALVRGFLLKFAGGLKNIHIGITVEGQQSGRDAAASASRDRARWLADLRQL